MLRFLFPYQTYQTLTAQGKRVNLFTGDHARVQSLKEQGITLLLASKEGVKEI